MGTDIYSFRCPLSFSLPPSRYDFIRPLLPSPPSELDLLLGRLLVLVIVVAQFGINGLWLRRLPGIGEQGIVLGLVGILEQGLARVLLTHGAQRDALPDLVLVGLVL